MDKPKQTNDQNQNLTFLQKFKLPLIIFSIGATLIFILSTVYYFQNKPSTNPEVTQSAPGAAPQDSFQAPAELSLATQQDCQASVELIDSSKDCSKKVVLYLEKSQACSTYNYSLDQAKSVAADGQFNDLAFAVAQCFVQKKEFSEAVNFLKQVEQLPAWEANFGSSSCSSQISVKALLENLEKSNFVCKKIDELSSVADSIKTKNFESLPNLISQGTALQMGSMDADLNCPVTFEVFKKSLTQLLQNNVQVTAHSELKDQQSRSVYIDFIKANEPVALLKFKIDENGCLLLSSLVSSLNENPE